MKSYTGIGSRETPKNVLELIKVIAKKLAMQGYTLRSGGANGADTAFEQGCDQVTGAKEIYLPWKGFNKNASTLFNIPPQAAIIAAELCGNRWKHMKRSVQQLMARNTMQVLGKNLDTPSDFVICWTQDGCSNVDNRTKQTGGTGQAIALASLNNIPVYNLQNRLDYDTVVSMITKPEGQTK